MGHLCRGPETVVVSLNLNQQVGWRSDFSGGDPVVFWWSPFCW